MSGPGYSYTTLTAQPGEPVLVSVSFYLDEHARIVVPGIDVGRPRLSIAHSDVSVSIGPRSDPPTPEDARIARTLATQAAVYAAEVERLSTAHEAHTEAGAGA